MSEPLFDDILASQNVRPKRTLPVTIICILYLIFMALTLGRVMLRIDPLSKTALVILIPAILLIAGFVYGLWQMKKWAAIVFIVLLGLGGIRRWSSGEDIFASLFSFITLIVIATQLKKMR